MICIILETFQLEKEPLCDPAHVPSADILIIESTFGRPEYIFPGVAEIIHKTNRIISEMYNLGVPVLLMGYPLGKAQLLGCIFWSLGSYLR